MALQPKCERPPHLHQMRNTLSRLLFFATGADASDQLGRASASAPWLGYCAKVFTPGPNSRVGVRRLARDLMQTADDVRPPPVDLATDLYRGDRPIERALTAMPCLSSSRGFAGTPNAGVQFACRSRRLMLWSLPSLKVSPHGHGVAASPGRAPHSNSRNKWRPGNPARYSKRTPQARLRTLNS